MLTREKWEALGFSPELCDRGETALTKRVNGTVYIVHSPKEVNSMEILVELAPESDEQDDYGIFAGTRIYKCTCSNEANALILAETFLKSKKTVSDCKLTQMECWFAMLSIRHHGKSGHPYPDPTSMPYFDATYTAQCIKRELKSVVKLGRAALRKLKEVKEVKEVKE